ncbi:MAG: tetratricopeptide repeat protein [bacterium]
MFRKLDPPTVALLFTLGLLGLTSFYPIEGMWGINHLAFLPEAFKYLFWAIAVVILVVLFVPGRLTPGEQSLDSIADFIFNRGPLPRLLIAALFTGAFILLRAKTHFLGDGYTLLSVFGQGESFIRRWAEPGSIFIIRKLQWLLGGYTRQTTLWTCQMLSVVSGAVIVLNFISIAAKIGKDARSRLIALISLLFSGVILLFFGYVEYYPLLWASATTFVRLGLGFLEHGRRLWLVLLVFVLTILIHLQAIFLLAGVTYLVVIKFSRQTPTFSLGWRKLLMIGGVTLIGVLYIIWLLKDQVNLAAVFLPIFTGPPQAPEYALVSTKHVMDLSNQVLVMFPGILVIVASLIYRRKKHSKDMTTVFLGLLSVGSLLFLLLIDPALGMARDWDLMSLTLLAPVLLLLWSFGGKPGRMSAKVLVTYLMLCALCSISYVAANTRTAASEERFRSLLQYYGTKDDTGWAIYAYYYLNGGEYSRAMELARFMEKAGIRLDKTYHILAVLNNKAERLTEAEKYYHLALGLTPRRPRLKNELGQLYMQQGRNEHALAILREARRLDPSLTAIAEGVGLAYYRLGHLDSALAIADTLFAADENSPGGHLLKMVIAITSGENNTAKYHFAQYLKYGSQRSDYDNIREYYGSLLP